MSAAAKPKERRVLVTGVGGAAGIAVIRALSQDNHDLFAGDCDPLATGYHLVAAERRLVLPRGDDPQFAEILLKVCTDNSIEVLIPTVDEELLALANLRESFGERGVTVLSSNLESLAMCLDKNALVEHVRDQVPCPRTAVLGPDFDASQFEFPVIAKPRSGRGGAGVETVRRAEDLTRLPADGTMIVQEMLPGDEYSVDVLIDRHGEVVAAVPRDRMRVDSGVAIVTRTLHDDELESAAGTCAALAGIRGVANVQFRRDLAGTPRLLEINPRFPGTLAVTIASGVNLPALALADGLGEDLPPNAGDFTDIGMVRMLDDLVVELDELTALQAATE